MLRPHTVVVRAPGRRSADLVPTARRKEKGMTEEHRPIEVEIDIEVRYAETDQMGVVHHANYIVWFELARTRLCELSGWHYADIERLGYLLMVTRVDVRYLRGALYGEKVQVRCRTDHLGSRGVRFFYQVEGKGGTLATGHTEHIWVTKDTRRPCRTPERLREPFARLAGELPPEEPAEE
jgi:acyl-CoA thioester hydrolase